MESEKRIKVLVVEDNLTQTSLLSISLTRRGFDVETFAYLAQVLERLERGAVDVILLDLSLPDSEGIQTLYAVCNRAPEVPVVVLSGINDHEMAQSALEGGAQDYLIKGMPSDESVSRCLRYAIERHRFEQKIWESERTTRLIVENAHDAFVSMDAEGRITGWNLKAETVFGWYRKDALEKPLLELIFPGDVRPYFEQQIKAFLQGQRKDWYEPFTSKPKEDWRAKLRNQATTNAQRHCLPKSWMSNQTACQSNTQLKNLPRLLAILPISIQAACQKTTLKD